MDISALSLAFGANVDRSGQIPARPGFKAAEEQVKTKGFIPPGAPPGPEPPPDLLVAGEGVEVAEPNAQPQELDFHPLSKVKLDINLPQPFWKSSALGATTRSEADVAPPVDDAMKWLVGQMGCYFFEEPPLSPDCLAPDMNGARPPASVGKDVICFPVDPDVPYIGARSHQKLDVDPTVSKDPGADVKLRDGASAPALSGTQVHNFSKEVLDKLNPTFVKSAPNSYERVAPSIPNKENPVVPEPQGPASPDASKEGMWKPRSRVDGARSQQLVNANVTAADTAAKTGLENPEPRPMKPTEASESDSAPVDRVDTGARPGKPDSNGDQGTKGGMPKRFDAADYRTEVSKDKLFGAKDALIDTDPASTMSTAGPTSAVQTTATPNGARLRPAEAELVVKQVADKLHMLAAARPRNGVTIHLNPEHLGSITVVVKSIGRMVDTDITASDSRVSEALDQNRLRLIEAMDSRGYQLQNVTVSQQSGNATHQDVNRGWQQPSQQQNHSQSGQSHGHHGQGDRSLDSQPKSNIRAWVRRGEGVDLAI